MRMWFKVHGQIAWCILCFLPLVLQAQSTVPISVHVTDPTGAPIPNARVELVPFPGSSLPVLVTDATGIASTSLTPGPYCASMSAPGFTVLTGHMDIEGPETIPVNLNIGPGCAVCIIAAPLRPGTLVVLAGPRERGVFTLATLKDYPHVAVTIFNHHTKKTEAYSGVPLMDLLAPLGVPHGRNLMGKALAEYILATGSDGYKTVLSLGEINPGFHPGVVLVADSLDGRPLGAKTGPFRLVVSEDANQTRSVRNLVSIEVKTAE